MLFRSHWSVIDTCGLGKSVIAPTGYHSPFHQWHRSQSIAGGNSRSSTAQCQNCNESMFLLPYILQSALFGYLHHLISPFLLEAKAASRLHDISCKQNVVHFSLILYDFSRLLRSVFLPPRLEPARWGIHRPCP